MGLGIFHQTETSLKLNAPSRRKQRLTKRITELFDRKLELSMSLTLINGVRHEQNNAFDQALFRVVVVPAHPRMLVGIGFLFDTVVADYHPLVALHLADLGLDPLPPGGRVLWLASQHPRDLVATHLPVQQRG